MVVGAIGGRTELVVVGGGPGGYVAALRAADAGLDVTLIEREALGGTCLNVGCIPSKALIEVASLRHRVTSSAEIGLEADVTVDADRLAAHLRSTSAGLRGGVAQLLDAAGVRVIEGDASFVRYDRLSILQGDTVSHLEFDNVILATGSRPASLPVVPYGATVLSSTGALALETLPSSMAVVGGGYIGVELGTAFAKLGVGVTIVDQADSILPDVPDPLRRPVERRLSELGVRIRTGATVEGPGDGRLLLAGSATDASAIDAEVVVVAVGRRPNSDQASLATLGLEIEASGHIRVDDQMRAATGIYAIGDLVDGPALAHKASAEAEVAVAAILGRPAVRPTVIPAVIFSDPEIMTVGVGLDLAEDLGATVHRFPLSASPRAHTLGDTGGAAFLVADAQGTIVGVHAVGPHVSELAGEATLAIEMAATTEDLSLTVHPHPTISESLPEAAWLAQGHPLHIRR